MKILISTIALLMFQSSWASTGEQALAIEKGKNQLAETSQKKVTGLADKTRDIVGEYREVLRKIENAKVYNHQMAELIQSQSEEKEKIKNNIVELKETNKEIIPFTLKLLASFKEFVSLDMPFLKEERAKRVEGLDVLMKKGNVTTAEKFRKVLEAHQIENDYGRSMETYKGLHKIGEREMTVDFLRVGRVFLGLQSIDGKFSAYWDKQSSSWKEMSGSEASALTNGIKIAQKTKAPDLLKLPVLFPTQAKTSKGGL